MHLASERGDILLAGLVKLLAFMLIAGLILFEAVAVAVNHVQLDDELQAAARAGLTIRSQGGTPQAAELAVQRSLDPTINLDAISVDRVFLTLTVSRPARVLLIDQIPPLREFAIGHASTTVGG